jgi:O-glycosyl hydrolase
VTAVVLALASIVVPMHRAFAGSNGTLLPVTNADGRLGLCNVLAGSPVSGSGPTWAQLAYSAGARTNRWEFRMDKLEAVQGTWDFSATDAVVQNDTAHGLDTEGILIGTPGWAVSAGQTAGNGLPRGLGRPSTDPANVWADFVRQTVRHYATQVAYWEIWNEPDLRFFWTSSPADYYQLLKVSYSVIKSVDPTAKVVVAGMVVPDLSFFSSVLDAARNDPSSRATHGYFDIAAWHSYGAAKLVYPNLVHMQSILADHGYGNAPIWVTEAGFPASNPNGDDRQAAYVLQSIAYAFAAGVARVFVYRASDDPTPKSWGVISADGIPRAAYTAFAVAAQYLSHVQAVTYDPTSNAERFVFYTPRDRIALLWNRGLVDQRLSLSASHSPAQQVDWQGNVSPLLATNGLFNFTVPGASYNKGPDPTGSVVGGPPVMILEDNTRPGNLGAPSYIPPVAGTQRQLVVLNDNATPASVEVSVPGIAWEREEMQVRPYAVQFVDLDLLGGSSYSGLFRVSSNSTVTAQALSGPVPVPGISPARSWTVSAAPSTLLLSNPTASTVVGHITAFGYGGRVRARQNLTVAPLETVRWSAPASLRSRGLSLSIQVAGKIMVSGISGPLTNAVAQPRSTWYTVAPQASGLVAFNPDASLPAHLDVRYVGSKTLKSQQLKLGGHRSYTLSTHHARTVVVFASHAITLGYANPAVARSPIATTPATRAALAVGGATTQVFVYNPAAQLARVTISVVGRAGSYNTSRAITHSGVFTLQVRKSGDPPRGVVINSNIPVVSTPSS